MSRHPRLPAIFAAIVVGVLGLGILAGTGQFRSTDLSGTSLAALEKRVMGSKDATLWCAYGDKLRSVGSFASAAKAYQRALEFRPELISARVNTALALGLSNDADAFYAYFNRLTAINPKLAVDLLDRPELAAMRSDPRWEMAASNAREQAQD